jgi:hypothetical protein
MSAVQNKPGGYLDDADRMMNSEKGPDLDEISPQIVTIEDAPGENEPDQNLACVPITLTIKKGSEPGENEPYQNLACVPASLTIKKGFEPGENEPDQNLARVSATLNIKKGSETVTIENEPGWDLTKSDTIEKRPDLSELPPPIEKQLSLTQNRIVKYTNLGKPLRSATDLKKAGLRIEASPGMVQQVAFENVCLYLPIVQLNDKTESYFRNLEMYEIYDHYGENRSAFSD